MPTANGGVRCATTKVSVAVIDVDNFRATATPRLRRGRRGAPAGRRPGGRDPPPIDLLARYHGDQFVALLPDTDGTGAGHVADRLLSRVRDLRPPMPTMAGT
jgi:GGDEF domain-containing protein